MILRTILEFVAIVAVLLGLVFEDKLIEWEDSVIRKNERSKQK